MAEKCTAWSAADGSIHVLEQDAKDRDFEIALEAWAREYYQFPVPDALPPHVDNMLAALIAERQKLLPIFKLLNGGSPVVAPRREDQPNV